MLATKPVKEATQDIEWEDRELSEEENAELDWQIANEHT